MNTVICVKKLSKSYNGKIAVDNLSFEMERGQTIGILGANGAGKSTSRVRPAFEGAGYTFIEQSFGGLCSIAICAGGLMGLPILVADYREKKY